MANKDNVKPWFVTGAYPTQAQFWQLFDWLRWKDEGLSIADVENLQTILNNTATIQSIKALFRDGVNTNVDAEWECPADCAVSGIVIKSENTATIRAGTTPGGDELFELEVQANEAVPISVAFYAETITNIYFSGIAGNTRIIILKNPS